MVDMEHLSDDGADLLMIRTAPPGKSCASLFVTFDGCAPLPPTARVCVSRTTLSTRGRSQVMARTVTCMDNFVEQNETFACSVVLDALFFFWCWLSSGQFVFRPLVFQRMRLFDLMADGGLVTGGCVGRRESISSVDLHLSTLTGIEQDTRVLTLAEQIIAAIPDRIKVLLLV